MANGTIPKANNQGGGSSLFSSIMPQAIGALGQGALGFSLASAGTGVQVAGANMSADAFRVQGMNAIQAGQYNASLEQLKEQRLVDAANRQFAQLIGNQRTSMAATGLRSDSKSFQMLANETLDVLTNELVRIKDDSHMRQEAIMFGAAQQQVSAFERAQAAAFQGQVAEFQAGVRQAQAIGGAVSSIGSLAAGGLS